VNPDVKSARRRGVDDSDIKTTFAEGHGPERGNARRLSRVGADDAGIVDATTGTVPSSDV
jgi:hypothetical protein